MTTLRTHRHPIRRDKTEIQFLNEVGTSREAHSTMAGATMLSYSTAADTEFLAIQEGRYRLNGILQAAT